MTKPAALFMSNLPADVSAVQRVPRPDRRAVQTVLPGKTALQRLPAGRLLPVSTHLTATSATISTSRILVEFFPCIQLMILIIINKQDLRGLIRPHLPW